MSAIAGLTQHSLSQIDPLHLDAMGRALEIHAPESIRIQNSEHCGLIARIRCITPEDFFERQPLSVGQLSIVADVRLDNREDLIRELGSAARNSERTPDSSLILQSYQKWGESCLDHLIGAFAFAIWDSRSHTLFLARDQRGEKTVYYHHGNDRFAFASMPKGLFALPWVERRLNEGKLAEFLVLDHSNHAKSFYRDVHRLPPAHYLKVTKTDSLLVRYWSLDLDCEVSYASDDEYVEHGSEILKTCIKANLRSATPVGAMMSGGLDSSTVACMAARILESKSIRLPTFTEVPSRKVQIGNPMFYADETPFIRQICELNPNIDPQFIPGLQRDLFDGIDERLRILEAPYRNPFNQVWLEEICQTASKQGVNVLLTGQTGNFTFSYDGLGQLPSILKSLRLILLAKNIRGLAKATGKSHLQLLKSQALYPLCPQWLKNAYRNLRSTAPDSRSYSAINPSFLTESATGNLSNNTSQSSLSTRRLDSRAARLSALESIDFFADYNQHIVSATGVDLRDPLGDIRFAKWTLSIPESQFMNNGTQRWLAKRIAKLYLPNTVIENPRRGLQAADWAYHLDSCFPSIRRALEEAKKSQLCRNFFDIDELERLVNSWKTPERADVLTHRYKLCRTLIAAQFVRSLQ